VRKSKPFTGVQDDEKIAATDSSSEDSTAYPLPDIKEVLRMKQFEQDMARMEEEEQTKRPKIKRTDKAAYARVRKFGSIRDGGQRLCRRL
jgi:chromatin segregation and condensation protein Rec8/ScpA/Scc1 (kleisin family)